MSLPVGVAKALLGFPHFWDKNNYTLAVIVFPGLFERLSSLGWTRRTAPVEKQTPARTMGQKMCRIGLPAYVRAGVRFLQRYAIPHLGVRSETKTCQYRVKNAVF